MSKLYAVVFLATFLSLPALSSETATDVQCEKCVDSSDIMNSAVTTTKIKVGAVATARLQNSAVTTVKLANGSVTVEKVAAELSNAIGTYCPVGESVVGMDQSGNFVCEPAGGGDSLEAQIAALLAYLEVDMSDPSKPVVRIVGANLQVVNGLGSTATKNGVGNLIVGYDEDYVWGGALHRDFCSDGATPAYDDCNYRGVTWGSNQKSGSHYIVGGAGNSYTQYGGLILGNDNISNRAHTFVTGYSNTASGYYSSVSGGAYNTASGNYSSVSGGQGSYALGDYSSVSGGQFSKASGDYSSVSGGYQSTAWGEHSSVSGGFKNQAIHKFSSVSGGLENTAAGKYSSVSGGKNRYALGYYDWRAGTLLEDY